MERLRCKYADDDKEKQFKILSSCILNDSKEASFATLGAELGMSEGAARVTLHRMRESFRQILRAEVAATVESSSEVDDELRHLIAVLRA